MIIEDDNGDTINMHNPDRDQQPEDIDVTFHRVNIFISGTLTPKKAYDKLCQALASMETNMVDGKDSGILVEWETDSYSVTHAGIETIRERSTSDLFPEVG